MASPPPSYGTYYNAPSPHSQSYLPNQHRSHGNQNYHSTAWSASRSPEPDSEITPLAHQQDRGEKPFVIHWRIAQIFVLFVLFASFGNLFEQFNNGVLYPEVRDQIRKDWSLEEKAHQRIRERVLEREIQQDQQQKEKEQKWDHEWKEKTAEWNNKKDEWNRREQQWDFEWKKKMDEWSGKQEEWRRKERDWEREWTNMQRQAREEAERAEKERLKRERMNLYWEDIQSEEHCTAHNTKKYSARLANLLPGIDALEACKATPLTIHGVTYDSPVTCEDRRSLGSGIHGHWVDTDEPICSTFWEYFKVKDCLAPGSGLRRVESPLGNLRSGDNYEDMCYTTPATLFGQAFSGPNAGCVDWGKYGHWGIWNIPDEMCL